MEEDRDTLLESYAHLTSKALEELTPEERRHGYRMLRLQAPLKIERTLEVAECSGKEAVFVIRKCGPRRHRDEEAWRRALRECHQGTRRGLLLGRSTRLSDVGASHGDLHPGDGIPGNARAHGGDGRFR